MNSPSLSNIQKETGVHISSLFQAGGILSSHVLGLEKANFSESDRHPIDVQKYFLVSQDGKDVGLISIPKEGILEGKVYDLHLKGGPSRIRFRLGAKSKVRRVKQKQGKNEEIDMYGIEDNTVESDLNNAPFYFGMQFSPLHIKLSPTQTIGKREKIAEVVKKVVRRIPTRASKK